MASLPARVCKTFLARPVCSGLAGRGRLGLGEADCVLCPRRGGGHPGTSVSEVAAKLAREGTWPHKPRPRLEPRRRGWGGDIQGRPPPAPCPGNEEEPGVRGKRGCSPQPPAPVSVHESLPTPTPTPPAQSLVHSIPLPGSHAWLRTQSLLLDGQGADTLSCLLSLSESTSGLPPPCPLLGLYLHPQTIISED